MDSMYQYPVTFLLIAANVIFSLIAFNNKDAMGKMILWPYGVKRQNQYYRFISSGFIHADFMHLAFNMLALYSFGRVVEISYEAYHLGGKAAYLGLYFLALIISDIPTYRKEKDNPNYLCLGASGAVSAVVFACVLFNPWQMMSVFFIPMPMAVFAVVYLVYCVVMSKRGQGNINHDAHLWGSLFGLATTLVLFWALRPELLPAIWDLITHPTFKTR